MNQNILKRWFEQRMQQRIDEATRSGFGWAMAAFYLEDMSMLEIQSKCEPACGIDESVDSEAFDKGAHKALELLAQLHPEKDDRI